jgi:hypothetical protein
MKKILLAAGVIASMFSLTANAHTIGHKHSHHKKVIVKKHHHKHHHRHVVRHHNAK